MLKVIEQLAVRVMLSGPGEEQNALQQHAGDPNYRQALKKHLASFLYYCGSGCFRCLNSNSKSNFERVIDSSDNMHEKYALSAL